MKKILLIMTLVLTASLSFGQDRAHGGPANIQSVTSYPGAIYGYVAGVQTLKTLDTLVNVDTGNLKWTFYNSYDFVYDLSITKITGTVAGVALLQGSDDNANWNTLTGVTTYCAGCQGASATITNTAGTKHYYWNVPKAAVASWKYVQVNVITSGTCTATYTGNAVYSF